MKFRITLKDPDGVYDCIGDAAKESLDGMKLDDRERESLLDMRRESISESIRTWVEFGEYVTVEFDTDEMTATVVPVSR